jgi:hypothetical protein
MCVCVSSVCLFVVSLSLKHFGTLTFDTTRELTSVGVMDVQVPWLVLPEVNGIGFAEWISDEETGCTALASMRWFLDERR